MICKNCGFNNAAGDQFCGSCGKFLDWTGEATGPGPADETQVGTPPSVAPVPAPESAPAAPPRPEPRPEAVTQPVRTQPASGAAAVVVCWNCGRQNPTSRSFCQQCGERLNAGAAAAAGVAGAGMAGPPRGPRAAQAARGEDGAGRRRFLAIGLALIAILLLAGGAAALFLGGGAPAASPTPTAFAGASDSPEPSPGASPSLSPALSPVLSPSASATTSPTAAPTATPTVPPTAPPTARPTPTPTPRPPTPEPTPANCDELGTAADDIILTPDSPSREIRPTRIWCVTGITFGDGVGDGVLKLFLTNPIFVGDEYGYGYSSARIGWNEVLMSGGTFAGSSVESPPMMILHPVDDLDRSHRMFPQGTIVELLITCADATPDCSGSVRIDRERRVAPPLLEP